MDYKHQKQKCWQLKKQHLIASNNHSSETSKNQIKKYQLIDIITYLQKL